MSAAILSSPSTEWLLHEFAVSFWAMIGGIVVFIGLVMEKIAEAKNSKCEPPFLKPYKLMSEGGWWALMFGIVIEIAVAGYSAAKDDAEINRIKVEAIRNDPRNQPLNKVEGYAMLLVHSHSPLVNMGKLINNVGGSHVSLRDNSSEESGWLDIGLTPPLLVSIHSENVTESMDSIGTNSYLRFDMFFSEDISIFEYPTNFGILTPNSLNAIRLILPIPCEVAKGKLNLTLNGSIEKEFEIPPQNSFGEAVTSIFTNGSFTPFSDEQYRLRRQ